MITGEFVPASEGHAAALTLRCEGDGDQQPCSFTPDTCPIAVAFGKGVTWTLEDVVPRIVGVPAPATPGVSVTFAPGAIQITLPEREVHITAPITVQMPERPRETLEIVRDQDGKMSRLRPLEIS